MSFAIDVEDVRRVLLSDGRWHRVADCSFEVSSFGYVVGDYPLASEPRGFSFVERRGLWRVRMSGPLSSVLALEERDYGAPADDEELDDEELEEDGEIDEDLEGELEEAEPEP